MRTITTAITTSVTMTSVANTTMVNVNYEVLETNRDIPQGKIPMRDIHTSTQRYLRLFSMTISPVSPNNYLTYGMLLLRFCMVDFSPSLDAVMCQKRNRHQMLHWFFLFSSSPPLIFYEKHRHVWLIWICTVSWSLWIISISILLSIIEEQRGEKSVCTWNKTRKQQQFNYYSESWSLLCHRCSAGEDRNHRFSHWWIAYLHRASSHWWHDVWRNTPERRCCSYQPVGCPTPCAIEGGYRSA